MLLYEGFHSIIIVTFRYQPIGLITFSIETVSECLNAVLYWYTRATVSSLVFSLLYTSKSSVTACLSLTHSSLSIFVYLWLISIVLFQFLSHSFNLSISTLHLFSNPLFPFPVCKCVKVTKIERDIGERQRNNKQNHKCEITPMSALVVETLNLSLL